MKYRTSKQADLLINKIEQEIGRPIPMELRQAATRQAEGLVGYYSAKPAAQVRAFIMKSFGGAK